MYFVLDSELFDRTKVAYELLTGRTQMRSAAPCSSFPQLSSPAQRELPQNQPTPSLNRASPRSESSPRINLLLPSIEQPRAEGAPPDESDDYPSLSQLGSPAQREPPETPSFFSQSSSPAQRQLPWNQPPPPSLNGAAPRSGSSSIRSSLASLAPLNRAALRRVVEMVSSYLAAEWLPCAESRDAKWHIRLLISLGTGLRHWRGEGGGLA